MKEKEIAFSHNNHCLTPNSYSSNRVVLQRLSLYYSLFLFASQKNRETMAVGGAAKVDEFVPFPVKDQHPGVDFCVSSSPPWRNYSFFSVCLRLKYECILGILLPLCLFFFFFFVVPLLFLAPRYTFSCIAR